MLAALPQDRCISENVENVVKPPMTPVVKNNLVSCDVKLDVVKTPTTMPMKAEPKTFMPSVPYGKFVPKTRIESMPTA